MSFGSLLGSVQVGLDARPPLLGFVDHAAHRFTLLRRGGWPNALPDQVVRQPFQDVRATRQIRLAIVDEGVARVLRVAVERSCSRIPRPARQKTLERAERFWLWGGLGSTRTSPGPPDGRGKGTMMETGLGSRHRPPCLLEPVMNYVRTPPLLAS